MPTYFTPIPDVPNQIADADTFNDPMLQLDAGIGIAYARGDDALSFALTNTAELSAARSPYASLKTRLDAITFGYVGGNIATLTNGTASAGQKNVTVDSTVGFLAGAYVAYQLVGGEVEYNTIASITPTTVLVMTTNIGTGGIGDNSYIGMISVSEYQAANAIPHDDTLTLPEAVAYANSDKFHVGAYGAWPGASQSVNTAGINAAIAAAKAAGGGTVQLRPGTYAYDGSIDLCETANIKVVGATGHFGTVLECHNSGKACIEIIGSKQITLEDLRIVGHGSDTPAVGIWTGRADPGVYSAGQDTSQIVGNRLQIYGAFTKALIYNTGCESNWWTQCYLHATNAACLAGVMTDQKNGLGLTPEHTTLDTTYPQVMCVIDKCLIVCADTATSYSPIYTVADYSPEIYNSYLACYGAPAVYLKGGMPGNSLIIRDTGVEGSPTYLIYGDYVNTTTPNSAIFRLDLYRFGGSPGTSGYSIFLEDLSVLSDSEISQCSFGANVRFYTVQNCKILGLSNEGAPNPALTIAGDVLDTHIHLGIGETLTISGSIVNTTIDYNKDYEAGYLLLAGKKGLAIGGAPGAANQGVIRRIYHLSDAWNPGAISDGAVAVEDFALAAVAADGKWFCQASYTGISATAGWILSAFAGSGEINVVLLNKTGGPVTPTGTLYLTAMQIEET